MKYETIIARKVIYWDAKGWGDFDSFEKRNNNFPLIFILIFKGFFKGLGLLVFFGALIVMLPILFIIILIDYYGSRKVEYEVLKSINK